MELEKYKYENCKEKLLEALENKKAIVFDMDGTLLDSLGMWLALDEKFLEPYGIVADEAFQREVCTMTLSVATEYMVKKFNLPMTGKEACDIYTRMVEDEYRYNLKLKPHALELLKELKARGKKMMIATANEYDIVYAAAKRNGAMDYVEGLITCSMVGEGKDSPKIYLTACEKLGIDVKDCMIFEDSYPAMETAMKAGFDVVAVYDSHSANGWNEACENTVCQVVFA